MRVVLLKDVPKVGKRFDVREVSDGYGRNFLLKHGFAKLATDNVLKEAEEFKKKNVAVKQMEEEEIEKGLAKLSTVQILIKSKSNEEGHLFAGVNANELSDKIKTQAGLVVLPEYIKIPKPIKVLGDHRVEVVVGKRKAEFKLKIERA